MFTNKDISKDRALN